MERELQVKELKAPNHLLSNYALGNETIPSVSLSPNSLLPGVLNLDLASHGIAGSQGEFRLSRRFTLEQNFFFIICCVYVKGGDFECTDRVSYVFLHKNGRRYNFSVF